MIPWGCRTVRHCAPELGNGPEEQICIVAVGGSGVGSHLLARVMEAYPEAKRHLAGLRMIAVASPRIDPASLPSVRSKILRLERDPQAVLRSQTHRPGGT